MINFFDVLDKYECWKVKCVKSVLGEFSFGVPIYRNKGTLWGPHFWKKFLLGYTQNGDNQRRFSKRYNAQLTKPLLTTKLSTVHVVMVGFSKLWVV